jgi:ribonuclease HII
MTWICSDIMKIGVDEAGRGPVIGPLVVCAFAQISENQLSDLGVKDSKLLSVKKRNEIYEKLIEMPHKVVVCSPERIDNSDNLNKLEVELFAEALENMPQGKVILDACDVNAERFGKNVSRLSKRECVAEHKADEKFLCVGAASIIAKVTRDNIIQQISDSLGFDIGSGYPSDPKTITAIKKLVSGDTPHECLRWSWKTVEKAWGCKTPPRPNSNQKTLF